MLAVAEAEESVSIKSSRQAPGDQSFIVDSYRHEPDWCESSARAADTDNPHMTKIFSLRRGSQG